MAATFFQKKRLGRGYRIFYIVNSVLLWIIALSCLFPLLHVVALAFSSNNYANSGQIVLFPKGTTLNAFKYVFGNRQFLSAIKVTLFRVVVGVSFQVLITVLLAYPMSKRNKEFKLRPLFLALIVFSMFFNGGLVPTWLLVKDLGLLDSMWVYIFPCAFSTYYALLTMNFFRQMPQEIEEAARIDGCDYFRTLVLVILPLSKPVLATIALYAFVGHWNSWFDGYIYSTSPDNYPVQTVLYRLLETIRTSATTQGEAELLANIGGISVASAEILVTTLPVLIVYPFVSKYFVEGIVLGSVKG